MSETTPEKRPAGRGKYELDDRLKAYKGIWVFVEHEQGEVHPVSWELMGEARKLADKLGTEVAGIVLGPPGETSRGFCEQAFHHGADLCYLIADPILANYRNDPFTKGLTDLVNTYKPEILLLGATVQGRDLAGSVATTLQTGLTADCTELNIDMDNRGLAATRPTFGGSLLCTIVTKNFRPQMATVRPRVMALPDKDPTRTGSIIEHPLKMVEADIITKVLEYIPDTRQDKPQLPFADIIVAGGRGMKKQENFALVWDLARVLGAEVGGSRPVVQAGWIDTERQVGQSGKTVRPKLYIAAGISGAVQHRVGMEDSDVIIAINNDPNAPIFQFATFGIVGNAMTILPALTEGFRKQLAVARKAG
ncbi:electron transfer flavoprotein subunit alpha/FixB family protein [Herbaspirillum sp. HC18]|nr:electron transfer flavoprotein subunit alpha/FixB family protein [Herbaspirillum sp. HC18]